jgi:periplasmic divalent cation tolerance protein
MKATDYCIVITTTDNAENADVITRTLLEEKLAACIQAFLVKSSYRWKGNIVTAEEIRLEIKTKSALFDDIKARIESLHTYDVPEIMMFRADDAKFDYLRWIENETRPPVVEKQADDTVWHNI